tara:strand:+ start:35 stop:478 length:444 start_codon:yes stop_codon:yes gene_type:complete
MGTKMKTLFLALVFSLPLYAQEELPVAFEDKSIVQEAQYSLRLNHMIDDQCRISLFVNKNENHFIVKTFTPRSIPSFESYIEEQDSNLKKEKSKFSIENTLEGKTKNHLFWIEGKNLIAKYQIYDSSTKTYRSEESMILENLNCANK